MITDNGACPICGSPVTKATRVGHFNTGAQAHVHQFKAFCESCQIVLERTITKQDTGWFSSSVDEQDVVGELSREEVAQVEKLLARYPHPPKPMERVYCPKTRNRCCLSLQGEGFALHQIDD